MKKGILILSIVLAGSMIFFQQIKIKNLLRANQQLSQLIEVCEKNYNNDLHLLNEKLFSSKEEISKLESDLSSAHEKNDALLLSMAREQKTALIPKTTPAPVFIQTPEPEIITPTKMITTTDDAEISRTLKKMKEAFYNKEYPKALEYGKELIDFTPPLQDARFWYIVASYETNPGKTSLDEKVASFLEGLPEEYNTRGEVSRIKGFLALEKGDVDEGIVYLKEARELNPFNEEVQKALKLLEG